MRYAAAAFFPWRHIGLFFGKKVFFVIIEPTAVARGTKKSRLIVATRVYEEDPSSRLLLLRLFFPQDGHCIIQAHTGFLPKRVKKILESHVQLIFPNSSRIKFKKNYWQTSRYITFAHGALFCRSMQEQEQTLFKDLRRIWNISDKSHQEKSFQYLKDWSTTRSGVLDPTPKRFHRTEVKQKEIVWIGGSHPEVNS